MVICGGCNDRDPAGEGANSPDHPSALPPVGDQDGWVSDWRREVGYSPDARWAEVGERVELLKYLLEKEVPVRDGVLTLDNPQFGLVEKTWDLGILSRRGVEATVELALGGRAQLPDGLEVQLGLYRITRDSSIHGSIDILWRCEPEAMPAILDHFERAWKENYPEGEGWEVGRGSSTHSSTAGIQKHSWPNGFRDVGLWNTEVRTPTWTYSLRADPDTGRLILLGTLKRHNDNG